MKYIRTSDGRIYETTGQDKKHPRYYNIANTNLEIDALGIVNQADTIEELCDAFVLETDGKITTYDKAYFTCFSEDWYHDYLKAFDMGGMLGHEMSVNGYGAIHIKDKGLIYVAKMNDKGELDCNEQKRV